MTTSHTPPTFSRRAYLASAAVASATIFTRGARAAEDKKPATLGLGFSLYGMRSLTLEDALKTCADIGYDCIELPVMADWPADGTKLTRAQQEVLRDKLKERGLRTSALMENLPALGDEAKHRENLARLKLACEFALNIAPAEQSRETVPPPIETVLGGKAGEWDAVKGRLVERLGDWAKVLAEAQVKLAIKAHVSNATQRPDQLIWLLEQVASPWLVAAYDYSHFQLQDLPMAETVKSLASRTVFVHVKDTEHAAGKRGFLLPGEGTIDHAALFRLLSQAGYRGDIVVEVSGQVFNKPGYEPIAAARKCYDHLAAAFEKAGIQRR